MSNPLPMSPPQDEATTPRRDRPPIFIVLLVGILFLQLGLLLFYWVKPLFEYSVATQPLALSTGAASPSPSHTVSEATTHNNVVVTGGPVTFAGEGPPQIYQVYGTPPYQTKHFAYADGKVDYKMSKLGVQGTESSIGVDENGMMSFFIPGQPGWKFPTPIELTVRRTGFKPVSYTIMVEPMGQDGQAKMPPTIMQRQ